MRAVKIKCFIVLSVCISSIISLFPEESKSYSPEEEITFTQKEENNQKDGGKKIEFTVFTRPYFEKNNSGLKGDKSFLVIEDRQKFDSIFGVGFVMGNNGKVIPKDAFEKKMVLALIVRGNSISNFTVESVTKSKTNLIINYKESQNGGGGNAKFASPLIILIDKTDFHKVEFKKDGKITGTVKSKSAKDIS